MVKVHNNPTDVDAGDQSDHIEQEENDHRVENSLSVAEDRHRAVAQECYVTIIRGRYHPQCVAEEASDEVVLTYECCNEMFVSVFIEQFDRDKEYHCRRRAERRAE